ncbi:hypothetical protein LCGC14_2744570, partial [marine sediment metagenome]
MRTATVIMIVMLVGVTALVGCSVSHHVRRVESVKPMSRPGIYYHLPETVVRVELPVKKTTTKLGELGKLLRDLPDSVLRIRPDFLTKGEIVAFVGGLPMEKDGAGQWELKPEKVKIDVSAAMIATRARSDQNAMFLVRLHGSGASARDVAAKLDAAGLITTGSSKFEDKTLEYVVKTVEVGATLVGKAGGFAGDHGATGATSRPSLLSDDALKARRVFRVVND